MTNKIYSDDHGFYLLKLDDRPVLLTEQKVLCFVVAKNEFVKLPYLLEYYRSLGINQFFFVDDHSGDGSTQYLLAQNDCHVFQPSNSFKASKAGVDWQNLLLNQYGIGKWCLVVDSDELFVYPYVEQIKIKPFCDFLDKEGSDCFFSFLLDMYPENMSEAKYDSGKPFTDVCGYFDKDYKFRKIRPKIGELPDVRVVGGPRVRKFYPFQKSINFISRALITIAVKAAEKLPFLSGDRPHYAPALIKMPLVKWNTGYKRLSNHVIYHPENKKVSDTSGALLHFKFFSDFHDKAEKQIKSGVHFNGSLEYVRYLNYLKKYPGFSFIYSGSREFKGSESLLTHGLIKSNDELENFVTKT